ncbi:hypothetical protein [Metaclostridioides mangenotii]|uniref:hypothetical protein n=1 Tax=Metaclostridioides mangenotii TaxID=1540 RepID=UPI0028E6A4E4|nr:hypothetical protein [Clostridioides mangenotii]
MKFKTSFIFLAIIGIVTGGCQKETDSYKNSVADKATQQKTMTKVQNNINEIMNKDYKYVLKNMGVPYKTNFYIEYSQLQDIDKTLKLPYKVDAKLVYPKSVEKGDVEGSAIYVNIKSNKVSEVKTGVLSKYDASFKDRKSDIRIEHTDIGIVEKKSKEIEKIDFKKYIGSDISAFESVISENSTNYKIYDRDDNIKAVCYLLKKDNKNISNKIVTILVSDNNIKSIQILSEEKVMKEIYRYMS